MTNTYGSNSDFPGVKVQTGGSVTLDPDPPELKESEYQLTTILIWMTLDISQPEHTFVGVDVNAAASALECFGYSEYESRPMVWATLGEIGERVYE